MIKIKLKDFIEVALFYANKENQSIVSWKLIKECEHTFLSKLFEMGISIQFDLQDNDFRTMLEQTENQITDSDFNIFVEKGEIIFKKKPDKEFCPPTSFFSIEICRLLDTSFKETMKKEKGQKALKRTKSRKNN